MAQKRYCTNCGLEVRPREERRQIPGTYTTMLRLSCPNCGKVLADIYDPEFEIKPVQNARISKG